MDEAGGIPEWVEMFDPGTSQYYYYNQVTFESSWEKPEGYEKPDLSKVKSINMLMSKELKAVMLMQRTWRAKIARRDVRKQRAAKTFRNLDDALKETNVWQKLKDPASGYDYWYNSESGEVTWNDPDAKPEPIQEEDESLENDWCAMVDEASGETYYYQMSTGEASWEKPDGFDDGSGSTLQDMDDARATELKKKMQMALEGKLRKKQKTSPEMEERMRKAREAQEQNAKAGARRWCEVYDESVDAFYYYDVDNFETTWEKPEDFVMDASDDLLKAALTIQGTYRSKQARKRVRLMRAKESSRSLLLQDAEPQEWVEMFDKVSGYPYYYNSKTEEMTWDKPTNFKASVRVEDTITEEEEGEDIVSEYSKRVESDKKAQQTELEKKQIQKQLETAELEKRKQAEIEAAELERKQAEIEAAELEKKKKAEIEAAELEKKKKAEIEAAELERKKQAEIEAAELERKKQAELKAVELEEENQADEETQRKKQEEVKLAKEAYIKVQAKKDVLMKKKQQEQEVLKLEEEKKKDLELEQVKKREETLRKLKISPTNAVPAEEPTDGGQFRSNESIRAEKRKTMERVKQAKQLEYLVDRLNTAQLSSCVTDARLKMLNSHTVEETRALVVRPVGNTAAKDQGKLQLKMRNFSQSVRVAELAVHEASEISQQAKNNLDEIFSSSVLLDETDDEKRKAITKETEAIVTKAIKAAVFGEAQVVVAVRSLFGIYAILMKAIKSKFNETLETINAKKMKTVKGLQRRLTVCSSKVNEASLRLVHVEAVAHRNFVTEGIQKGRFDELKKKKRFDGDIMLLSDTDKVELVEEVENEQYDAAFEETVETAEEQTKKLQENKEESFDGELGFFIEQAGGSGIFSPWWPSYLGAVGAVRQANDYVKELVTFTARAVDAINESREARLMLAEEASMKALLSFEKGTEYDIECRRRFVELCRKSWKKGLEMRKGKKNTDTSSDTSSDTSEKDPASNETLFASPWEACQSYCTLSEFKLSLEHAIARRVHQEGRDFNIDAPDPQSGRILLHTVCWFGRVDLANFLLEDLGANPNAIRSTLDPTAALIVSVRGKSPHVTQKLLEAGANILARDAHGETALHWAARVESLPCVRLLLEYAKKQAQREAEERASEVDTFWRLVGSQSERGRTPTELLPRDQAGKKNSEEGFSYTGKRIHTLLRESEIEAQQRLLNQDINDHVEKRLQKAKKKKATGARKGKLKPLY